MANDKKPSDGKELKDLQLSKKQADKVQGGATTFGPES